MLSVRIPADFYFQLFAENSLNLRYLVLLICQDGGMSQALANVKTSSMVAAEEMQTNLRPLKHVNENVSLQQG